tara:strand:- start:13282 stop:13761 length:480 start_codon:yes stop_codon:yes gene_type:complete
MINFIEKGRGLILSVKAAGHRVWHQDRVCYSTNDEAVQAIIDSYDPLPLSRTDAKKRLVEQFNLVMEGLEAEYPEVEKRTFTKQEAEARAFIIDSNANTPTLSPIALARGISLIDLVTKTLVKADLYTAQVGALIGQRQYKEDLIDAEADWLAVEGINL